MTPTRRAALAAMFRERTGRTTHVPKGETKNPAGYQQSRVTEYRTWS